MLHINKSICSRTYDINNVTISYVIDVHTGMHYFFKDLQAKLWTEIIEKKGKPNISQLLNKYNIREKDFNCFLYQLKEEGLITCNLPLTKKQLPEKTTALKKIHKSSPNYTAFSKAQQNLFSLNNFLGELFFNLNYSCNLNCKHCFNLREMKNMSLSFEQAKKIIDEAYNLGITTVTITGGECTINKDFLKIVKYIRSKYLILKIMTNGQELYDNPDLLKDLISISPSIIQLSLYSMNPEIHDEITQIKGSHHKTIEVIKKLKENNICTMITCFATSINENDCKDVEKFANSINANFSLGHKFINNPQNNNIKMKPSKEFIKQYYIETINLDELRNSDGPHCSGGFNKISIMPNGDVTPCNYCNYPLGNINNISLNEIRKTSLIEFHNKLQQKNLKECFKHEYCKYCIYCPVYTCYEKDGFLKKSDVLCEDAIAYKEAVDYLRSKKK